MASDEYRGNPHCGDEGRIPVFSFEEVFEDGEIYRGFSEGGGIFTKRLPDMRLHRLVFHARKDRLTRAVYVRLDDAGLKSVLSGVFKNHHAFDRPQHESVFLPISALLQEYLAMKKLLSEHSQYDISGPDRRALELLVNGLLREFGILSGFNLETLRKEGIVGPVHWQDIEYTSAKRQLKLLNESIDLINEKECFPNDTNNAENVLIASDSLASLIFHDLTKAGNMESAYALINEWKGNIPAECLTVALEFGEMKAFWMLIEHGAEVNCDRGVATFDPLYVAAKKGYFDAVKSLVERGAYLEGNPISRTSTPLTAAASEGRSRIVKYLIGQGAKLYSGDALSNPLDAAAQNGHFEISKHLICCGAPVHQSSAGIWGSPLVVAAANGHRDVVRLLVREMVPAGAGVIASPTADIVAVSYQLALESASVGRHDSTITELVHHLFGISPFNSERQSIELKKGSFVNTIIDRGTIKLYLEDVEKSAPSYRFHDSEHQSSKLDSGERSMTEKCPHVAAIEARERHKLKVLLQETFCLEHYDFIARAQTAQDFRLKQLAENIGSYRSSFKDGVEGIQAILDGHIPTSVRQVFNCLKVASAMRAAGSHVHSQLSHKMGLQAGGNNVWDSEEFVRDLSRWRLIVNDDDKPLYDELTRLVWGRKDPQTLSSDVSAALERFKQIISVLVSSTCPKSTGTDPEFRQSSSEDHSFEDIQQAYMTSSQATRPYYETSISHAPLQRQCTSRGKKPMQFLNGAIGTEENSKSFSVVLLAGAIFGSILAFLLSMRRGVSTLDNPFHDLMIAEARSFGDFGALTRNCCLALLYLGLKESYEEIEAADEEDEQMLDVVEAGPLHVLGQDCLFDDSMLHNSASDGETFDDFAMPPWLEGVDFTLFPDYAPAEHPRAEILASSPFDTDNPRSSFNSTDQSTPETSPSSSSRVSEKPRQQCRNCGRTFTNIGNLNVHIRTGVCDAMKIAETFHCRYRSSGCRYAPRRKDNLAKHEAQFCKYRHKV